MKMRSEFSGLHKNVTYCRVFGISSKETKMQSFLWTVGTLVTTFLMVCVIGNVVMPILYRKLGLPLHPSGTKLLPHASRSHKASYSVMLSVGTMLLLGSILSDPLFAWFMPLTLSGFVGTVALSLIFGLLLTLTLLVGAVYSPRVFLLAMCHDDIKK